MTLLGQQRAMAGIIAARASPNPARCRAPCDDLRNGSSTITPYVQRQDLWRARHVGIAASHAKGPSLTPLIRHQLAGRRGGENVEDRGDERSLVEGAQSRRGYDAHQGQSTFFFLDQLIVGGMTAEASWKRFS